MANYLNKLGHNTCFLFNEPIANNLQEMGHKVYDCTTPDLTESKCNADEMNLPDAGELMLAFRANWQSANIIENIEFFTRKLYAMMLDKVENVYNDNVREKMKLLKPDLLVIDNYFGIPALHKLGIPYARMYAASPLALHQHPDLPQFGLGLPTNWNKQDPIQRESNDRAYNVRKELHDKYNTYWQSQGLAPLPEDAFDFAPESPYLNIYMYPDEMDYKEYLPLRNWQRSDCMVRDQNASRFELPHKLIGKAGKLIYLSLGSMACADAVLMKRLTSMLADCPHRFIVTTGPHHEEYELPDNMWGDKFLPQLEILSVIDLIITHGGNNTLTECFYYGVPGFIVCPLFFDQFDNAQRIQEVGLGVRLDPYNCTKEELHDAIECMLNKDDVKERMQVASQRMQMPESRDRALNLIREFVSSANLSASTISN